MSCLFQLRQLLREEGVNAFIVESGDRHQSEYIHESDMRRKYISNFSGSAGTALILQESAYLWTDGRYFLQASMELSSDWTLMKSGQPGVLELEDFLVANLGENSVVGVDPNLMSTRKAQSLAKRLGSKSIALKALSTNPVDTVWGSNKPSLPQGQVRVHDLKYAGVSHVDKIAKLQNVLREQAAKAVVLSALDEIAWLLNIRGSDISFNPVVMSYVLLTDTDCHLFIDSNKCDEQVRLHLAEANVILHDYFEIDSMLRSFAAASTAPILADSAQLSWALHQCIESQFREFTSPIALMKSLKNEQEVEGMAAAHIRDGAALTAFLCWLKKEVTAKPNQLSEVEAADILETFRRRIEGFVSLSFDTIAGYGPNGAIIHYHAHQETAAKIGVDSFFLLDSGAQYADGTTDVTRTVHFGNPSEFEKLCYTAVMKGHVDLSKAVFPENTVGSKLDPLARLALWNLGLDYNHGTGHGVGAFLNVHEGPQAISFRKRDNEQGFRVGMTISNEPGYYRDGEFGIRTENILVTVPAATPYSFNSIPFCTFRTFTMVPYQNSLLNVSLLDNSEIDWINSYHAQVREKLLPLMTELFPEAVEFLIAETQPIAR